MLKKLVICASVVLLLIVGVGAYAILNANRLVEVVRPQLEAQASKLLNTKVEFAQISFNFLPSPRFVLTEFSLGDSPDEQLTVQEVRTHVELLPLVSGTLKVNEVTIVKPVVSAQKGPEGFSINGLPKAPRRKANKGTRDPKPEPSTTQPTTTNGATSPLVVELDRFSVEDATFTFTQSVGGKSQVVAVSQANLTTGVRVEGDQAFFNGFSFAADLALNDASLGPIAVESDTLSAVLSKKAIKSSDLLVELLGSSTRSTIDFSSQTFSGKAALKTAHLDLEKLSPLKGFVPALEYFKPHGTVNSELSLALDGMKSYTLDGTATLNGVGLVAAGHQIDGVEGTLLLKASPALASATTKAMKLSFNGSPLDASFSSSMQGAKLSLDSLTLKGLGGVITSEASMTLGETKPFSSRTKAEGLAIPEVMKALMMPGSERALGTIQTVSATISGNFGPDLIKSMQGPIKVSVKDTVLKDINLLRDVLKKVDGLPFMNGALRSYVPPEFEAPLALADTPIDTFTADLALGSGIARINDFIATNALFDLTGRGTFDLPKKEVDLETEIALAAPLATPLVMKVKELSAVQESNGEVILPLEIRGVAPKLIVIPNLKSLVKAGVKNKFRQKATEALGNILGF